MKKTDLSKIFNDIEISSETLMDLAFETGLIKRKRLIKPSDLLFSICSEVNNGTTSYNDIAAQMESDSGVSVCRQAIWKKVTKPCLAFFEKVLELVILNKIDKATIDIQRTSTRFKRILVQDSTIIRLPVKLFDYFSGVANKTSKLCNARVQGVYDIINERFISFSIDSYSKNDLKAAPELSLEKGDLSLRDRGYLIFDEIQRHINIGADCIFRYKNRMSLLDPITEKPIDILAMLEKESKLDIEVKLNNKDKTLVRLVAVPVNEKTANIRRMKAKKEKKLLPQKYI